VRPRLLYPKRYTKKRSPTVGGEKFSVVTIHRSKPEIEKEGDMGEKGNASNYLHVRAKCLLQEEAGKLLLARHERRGKVKRTRGELQAHPGGGKWTGGTIQFGTFLCQGAARTRR